MSIYRMDFILAPSNWSELNVVPVSQNVSFPMKTTQVKKKSGIMTAKVQIHKFYKPQALHNGPHFFFRYTARKMELPIATRDSARVDKFIEPSIEPGRDFVKDGFHLFVARCVQTGLTPERRFLGGEGILECPSVLNHLR
jgi:hypothetical protein